MTRRHVLTTAGVAATAGLAGCMTQVAARTTNTGASPAAMFGGIRDDRLIGVTAGDTIRFSPTVRVEERFLSGDVELEAWMTNAVCAPPTDYNSTRSNRRKNAFGGGPDSADDDGVGEDADAIDARSAALELERQLLRRTREALEISRRSARTGRNPQTGKEMQGHLDDMSDTIDEIRATLARCGDDVCETVRSNADARKRLVEEARSYFEGDQQFAAAEEALEEVRLIVESDVELLEASLERDSESGRSARIARLRELTGASDGEIRGMYEYLDGDPVLSERCVITVPDARAPQGGPSVESLITPDRLIRFVTGRADAEGTLYSWGGRERAAAAEEDEEGDDDGESCEPHSSGVEVLSFCWGTNSTTAISGPTHTYGDLDVLTSDAGVVVVNTPPTATDERSMVGVTADGRPTDVGGLEDWGREIGPASSTSTVVCQVLVRPAGCPCPFPALLYVQRHENADQYVYSCGWVVDDSCLYEDSTTVLTMHRGRGGGGGKVSVQDVAVTTPGGDISEAEIRRMVPDDVSPAGSQMFSGRLDGAVRAGAIPDDELAEAIARTVASDGDVYCSCCPFDGHCLHLVDDGNTSDTVKFKAGADLSKSVN